MIGLPISGLEPRSPTALALPPCRTPSGMATRKTAPDRRAARFLSSTSWQASPETIVAIAIRRHHATYQRFLYIRNQSRRAQRPRWRHGSVRRRTWNAWSTPARPTSIGWGALVDFTGSGTMHARTGIGHPLALTKMRTEWMSIKYSLILTFFHCQQNSQLQKKPLRPVSGLAAVMICVKNGLLSWCRSRRGPRH